MHWSCPRPSGRVCFPVLDTSLNLPLPNEREVENALSRLAPFLDSCPYPATLIDRASESGM